MQDLPSQIAERYGRSPRQLRQNRRRVAVIASTLMLLLLGWLVWVNFTGANQLSPKTTAYQILGSGQVLVTFVIEKPTNQGVTCALKALKQDYGIVGYREVSLSGDGSNSATIEQVTKQVLIKTTEQAVTGLVDRCWIH